MGLKFRKSINLGKHFRINISKNGIGYSYGVKGMRHTVSANGKHRTTYSIPGTGISYTQTSNPSTESIPHSAANVQHTKKSSLGCYVVLSTTALIIVLALIFQNSHDIQAPTEQANAELIETVAEETAPFNWCDNSTILITPGETAKFGIEITDAEISPDTISLTEYDTSIAEIQIEIRDNVICYSVTAKTPGIINITASSSTDTYVTDNFQIIVEENYQTTSDIATGSIYVINTATKKIHRSSCSAVKNISDENKSTATSVESLLSSGYTFCDMCH